MHMHLNSVTIAAVLLIIGLIVGAFVAWHVYRAIRNFSMRRRFARGAQGEERARAYLLKHGFSISDEQHKLSAHMFVDGEKTDFTVVADYLVRRKGRTGIVEVKTGTRAIDPASRETRRQIFEYYHLYDVDDFYFFDAESERLMAIRFAGEPRLRPSVVKTWLWGFAVGSVITIALVIGWRFV
jgi:hypothetical protein